MRLLNRWTDARCVILSSRVRRSVATCYDAPTVTPGPSSSLGRCSMFCVDFFVSRSSFVKFQLAARFPIKWHAYRTTLLSDAIFTASSPYLNRLSILLLQPSDHLAPIFTLKNAYYYEKEIISHRSLMQKSIKPQKMERLAVVNIVK